jgi:hypothetical protein
MNKQRFADLSVGTIFVLNGTEYVKIKDERISCCKLFNATLSTDSKQKHFIVPITEVEVQNG